MGAGRVVRRVAGPEAGLARPGWPPRVAAAQEPIGPVEVLGPADHLAVAAQGPMHPAAAVAATPPAGARCPILGAEAVGGLGH
nr:hypothetical protein [Mycolicibacterium fortuitum]